MLFYTDLFTTNRYNVLEKDVSQDPYWYKYAFVNLFSNVGAHIGHSINNTVRQAAWMIYGFKWDLVIIDLSLTITAIKSSFILASCCAAKHQPFWFVTQDKGFYKYSRFLAIKCGEFSSTLY
jgi:ribosomal protein S2